MSKPIKNRYSDDKYDGIILNKEIISLKDDLRRAKKTMVMTQNCITEIQNNCDHEYMFSCKGAYEDNYVCRICGHETEK